MLKMVLEVLENNSCFPKISYFAYPKFNSYFSVAKENPQNDAPPLIIKYDFQCFTIWLKTIISLNFVNISNGGFLKPLINRLVGWLTW